MSTEKTSLIVTDNDFPQSVAVQDATTLPKELISTLEMFGSIRTFQQLANVFSAQFIRGLQLFQQREGYKSFGFSSMDDFLNEYENSPIKKTAYYEKLHLLEKEGDAAFDLMNSLKISKAERKLLGSGAIEIDGNTVVIGDKRVDAGNNNQIKELVKELARENAKQNAFLNDLENHNLRLAETVRHQKADIAALDAARLRRENPDGDPYDAALMRALAALVKLCEEAANLPFMITQTEKSDVTLRSLWNQMLILRRTLHREDVFAFDDFVRAAPYQKDLPANNLESAPNAVVEQPQATRTETAAEAARRIVRENMSEKDWNDLYDAESDEAKEIEEPEQSTAGTSIDEIDEVFNPKTKKWTKRIKH